MASSPITCLWRGFSGYLIVLSILPSCHSSPPAGQAASAVNLAKPILLQPLGKPVIRRVEFFADSLAIGQPRHHKLTIAQYQAPDSTFVDIHFYSRQSSGWQLRSHFHFQKDYLTSLSPELVDYNHDRFIDFTYQSDAAARGSNKMQRLFLYQPLQDQLLCIKNAERYPNLLYNKKLYCLDAFLVHGGCTTVFLKISGDSLRPFASVDLADSLTVRTYNGCGGSRQLLRKPLNPTVFHFTRFKDYRPLQAYTNADF